MFIKGSLREYERTPFITPIRYSVTTTASKELQEIRDIAVSVDISNGGLGILTDFPLEQGYVLTFEDTIEIKNIVSKKAAVVRWTGKTNGKYRAGLKFV